ncbi:MAG: hypothetical protein Q8872_02860 [Candidatus Phytoplasma australasiaticum]|nr:hypothetical protein [Candidatus Phytoplasma australasiaticum]
MNPEHKCFRSNKNPMLSCKYLQKMIKNKVLAEPKLKIKALGEMLKKDDEVYANRRMIERARKEIIKDHREEYKVEFANLRGYAAELKRSNPGSTVSIAVTKNGLGEDVFSRMYVCFDALKQGWKQGCRRFIGVDGCFLKTAQKGILLVAVGRDANNQMYPLAWAVVEGETKNSWRWFLHKLLADIDMPTGEGLTIISDQQKVPT